MKESSLEKSLREGVRKLGGVAVKNASNYGTKSLPDRTVYMPGEKVYLVEMKAEGLQASAAQARKLKRFADMGFFTTVINSMQGVRDFLQFIKNDR